MKSEGPLEGGVVDSRPAEAGNACSHFDPDPFLSNFSVMLVIKRTFLRHNQHFVTQLLHYNVKTIAKSLLGLSNLQKACMVKDFSRWLSCIVSSFLAFARLLFILYKLIATAVISSFNVLARNKFSRKVRQTAYNVHSFHLLGEPGQALILAGLKWTESENFRQKTGQAGPKKQRAGAGRDFQAHAGL